MQANSPTTRRDVADELAIGEHRREPAHVPRRLVALVGPPPRARRSQASRVAFSARTAGRARASPATRRPGSAPHRRTRTPDRAQCRPAGVGAGWRQLAPAAGPRGGQLSENTAIRARTSSPRLLSWVGSRAAPARLAGGEPRVGVRRSRARTPTRSAPTSQLTPGGPARCASVVLVALRDDRPGHLRAELGGSSGRLDLARQLEERRAADSWSSTSGRCARAASAASAITLRSAGSSAGAASRSQASARSARCRGRSGSTG